MDLRDDIFERVWNSKKIIDKASRTKNLMSLQNKELNLHDETKNKNYIMLILHQLKLMTNNRFGILLILIENIKRDIT